MIKPQIILSILFLLLPLVNAEYKSNTNYEQQYSYYDTANRESVPDDYGYIYNASSLETYCSLSNHLITGFAFSYTNENGDTRVIAQTPTTIEVINPTICDVVSDIVPAVINAQVGFYEDISASVFHLIIPNANMSLSHYKIVNDTLIFNGTTAFTESIVNSGVMCTITNDPGISPATNPKCYYQTNRNNLMQFNLSDNTIRIITMINTSYNDTYRDKTPALMTWSSNDHIVISGMQNLSGDTVGVAQICIYQPLIDSKYVTFDGDGCLTIAPTLTRIRAVGNPLISKYGTGSTPQISVPYIDYAHPGGADAHHTTAPTITSYSVTGAIYSTIKNSLTETTYNIAMSNPFIIKNGSADMHCAIFDNRAQTSTLPAYDYRKEILCNGNYGSSQAYLIRRTGGSIPSSVDLCTSYSSDVGTCNVLVADMYSSMTGKEILTYNSYWNFVGSTMTATQLSLTLNSNYTSYGDVNDDGAIDLIYSTPNILYMMTSFINNTPPVLDNTLNYGGYFGYMNPVCVNTTATFDAQECTLAVPTNCNYDNDNEFDTERLISDCGIPGTSANGSYNIDNPTFNCYYNTTGTYNVILYLQDNRNTDDLAQYNTLAIPITVMNGVPGVTCNIPSTTIQSPINQTSTGVGSSDVDDAIDETLGLLFGTSTKLKAIVGIGLVIGIGAGVAASTGSGIAIVAGCILGLVLVTVIGLLSAYVLVISLVGMILLLILSKFVANSQESG